MKTYEVNTFVNEIIDNVSLIYKNFPNLQDMDFDEVYNNDDIFVRKGEDIYAYEIAKYDGMTSGYKHAISAIARNTNDEEIEEELRESIGFCEKELKNCRNDKDYTSDEESYSVMYYEGYLEALSNVLDKKR